MDTLTCEECAKTLELTKGSITTEQTLGWVRVPCVMYGHLEWWNLCPECGSPERQRAGLDAYREEMKVEASK